MSRRPKYYPINSIRSKFQTVAIDNKYQVFMEPNLNVYNAAAHIGIPRRFVDEDLRLYASEAVLPGSSFADVEVSGDRQGITERMPFKRIYDDVTITFMVDRNYKVLKYFEAWLQLINPLHGDVDGKARNQVMTLNYPKKYKCNMSVVKFNKDYFRRGGAYVYYCFIRSWPLSISSIPVNYDSGSALKLNVTFRYERYVMENVTRGMIRSGWKGYSDSFDPWMGTYTNTSNVPTNNDNGNNTSSDDTVVDSSSVVNQFDYTQSFKSFENSGYDSFSNFLGGEFITGQGGVSPLFPFYDMGRNSDTVKENIEKSQYGSFFMPF